MESLGPTWPEVQSVRILLFIEKGGDHFDNKKAAFPFKYFNDSHYGYHVAYYRADLHSNFERDVWRLSI